MGVAFIFIVSVKFRGNFVILARLTRSTRISGRHDENFGEGRQEIKGAIIFKVH
jgi:hypothetical protein